VGWYAWSRPWAGPLTLRAETLLEELGRSAGSWELRSIWSVRQLLTHGELGLATTRLRADLAGNSTAWVQETPELARHQGPSEVYSQWVQGIQSCSWRSVLQ
jgi:hypothetical protein